MSPFGRCLCSRPAQDVLLQGPGEPSCRARVWPPDEDLHPHQLLSITGLPLQGCRLLSQISPHTVGSAAQDGHLRSDAKPQMHWMSSGRTKCVPGGLQQVPLLPGLFMGLQELAAVPCMQNQWSCQLHIADIPELLGQFHTQAGVWGMLSCCPMGS